MSNFAFLFLSIILVKNFNFEIIFNIIYISFNSMFKLIHSFRNMIKIF